MSICIVYTYFFIYRSGDDYDNCLLSDEPFGSLNTAADLDYDLSWNVYRLSETNCVNDNYSEGKKNITYIVILEWAEKMLKKCKYRKILVPD